MTDLHFTEQWIDTVEPHAVSTFCVLSKQQHIKQAQTNTLFNWLTVNMTLYYCIIA